MYYTTNILIVDAKGTLRRIFCPFAVIVLVQTPGFTLGELVYVESIKVSYNLHMWYLVNKQEYPYHFFYIRI